MEDLNNEIKTDQIYVGLDIGTTKIVCLVGRKNEFGKLEILGYGRSKSLGVKRGVVANIVQTIESIQTALNEAKEKTNIKIQDVAVGIAGQHIRSMQHIDYIIREDSEKYIDDNDTRKLVDNVKKLRLEPGEEIIHVLAQEYKIDNEANILKPEGMCGSKLEANFHVVAGQISAMNNITRCVKDAGLNVADIHLEPLASLESTVTEEERDAGVVLVDIGGGTTDIAIFKDKIIRHTAVVPFGGNIITNDIKEGCSIIEKQAEQLKLKFGSALPSENNENEIVSIPGLRGHEPKEISIKNLSKIIKARLEEILNDVNKEIRLYQDSNHQRNKLIAGIVLTGGGANLKHIKQLCEYVTGLPTRIGYANEYLDHSSPDELSSPIYATSVGLVMRYMNNKIKITNYKSNEPDDLSQDKDFFGTWAEKFLSGAEKLGSMFANENTKKNNDN